MDDYKNSIEFFAKNSESFEFENKGREHAAIVLQNMLKYSKTEFLIFSGCLDGDVADNVEFLFELEKYLESGKTFKLLLESDINSNKSEALKLVEKHSADSDNVKIKIASTSFLGEIKSLFEGEILHFSVADSKAFRLETDRKDFKAIGNFNDSIPSEALKGLFDTEFP